MDTEQSNWTRLVKLDGNLGSSRGGDQRGKTVAPVLDSCELRCKTRRESRICELRGKTRRESRICELRGKTRRKSRICELRGKTRRESRICELRGKTRRESRICELRGKTRRGSSHRVGEFEFKVQVERGKALFAATHTRRSVCVTAGGAGQGALRGGLPRRHGGRGRLGRRG